MTRKTRRLIFYIFLILFIILAFAIVLYAQGYSFDWQKKSLAATGGFYFKSYPKKSDIYINNKYRGKTNKFIKRLLPKEYNIKISKPDYYDWQKILEVKSGLVTTAKNILLIPKNPLLNQITNYNVKYFSISNNQKKIIYLTYPKFALRLKDLANNTDVKINSSLLDLKNLLDISWSSDDKKLLLSFPSKYYILDLENPLKIIDLNNLIKLASNYKISGLENVSFHSQDPAKIYFLSKNNLFLADLTGTNPPIKLSSKISTYALNDNKIFYTVLADHYIYKMNLDGSAKEKIVKIPKPTEEIKLSPDKKKLFWKNKNEIGIVWLEASHEQPIRKRYGWEIITKTPETINQAIWFPKTNEHIIFTTKNKIKITELDGRGHRNTFTIATVEKPLKIFYNQWNEKLYILSNEHLFEIDMNLK